MHRLMERRRGPVFRVGGDGDEDVWMIRQKMEVKSNVTCPMSGIDLLE